MAAIQALTLTLNGGHYDFHHVIVYCFFPPPPPPPRCSSLTNRTINQPANCSTFATMGRLDNDPFLTELTKLYTSTKESGTVYVTMKRVSVERVRGARAKKAGTSASSSATKKDDDEYMCLLRARAGDSKISTLVCWQAMSMRAHTHTIGVFHQLASTRHAVAMLISSSFLVLVVDCRV
jgi:hypothetical protein